MRNNSLLISFPKTWQDLNNVSWRQCLKTHMTVSWVKVKAYSDNGLCSCHNIRDTRISVFQKVAKLEIIIFPFTTTLCLAAKSRFFTPKSYILKKNNIPDLSYNFISPWSTTKLYYCKDKTILQRKDELNDKLKQKPIYEIEFRMR